jgi:uncharacterized membrane protein
MISRKLFTLVSIVLLISLVMPAGWAGAVHPLGGGNFIRMGESELLILFRLGISPLMVEDYGTFYWLELSDADYGLLKHSGLDYTAEPDANQVRLTGHTFDPVKSLPKELFVETGGGQAPGLRLVQFAGPAKAEWLKAVEKSGIIVLQYYPHNTFLVWAAPHQTQGLAASQPYVRWQGPFSADFKIMPGLTGLEGEIEYVAVTFFNDGKLSDTLEKINHLGGAYVQHFPAQPDGRFYTAIYRLDAARLTAVAQIDTVWALEFSSPKPGLDDEIGAQIQAGNYPGGSPVTGYYDWLEAKGVSGAGITWADNDTGLNANHPDITGRVTAYVSYGSTPANTDPDGHGSHTAGAIFGDGRGGTGIMDPNGFYWGTGAAPESNMVVQNGLMSPSWPPSGGWQVFSRDSVLNNAMGSSNSWFTGASGSQGYSSAARTHDLMVRDANFTTTTVAEPLTMVFSAGNAGGSCGSPCYTSITEPKEAKNLIVIGASDNYPRTGVSVKGLANFSSRGPAQDGRILPNLTAPGRQTASFNGSPGYTCGSAVSGPGGAFYNYCSGTSMAAPFASGAAVLAADWWAQEGRGQPSPAMTKALLINGASSMQGGSNGWSVPMGHLPNNDYGWGMINLDNVIRNGQEMYYLDQTHLFSGLGESWTLDVGVADPSKPFKVSLAWTDAAGAIGANPALVNNLDLTVNVNGSLYRGNRFSSGWSITGGSPDSLNNMENVYLQSASGTATITVTAAAINGDGVPYNGDTTDQDFALVCYNCAMGADFTLDASPEFVSVCSTEQAEYTLNLTSLRDFDEPVSLSISGVPAGAQSIFVPNPVTPSATSLLTISETDAVEVGVYALEIQAYGGDIQRDAQVSLEVYHSLPGVPELISPEPEASKVSLLPTFSWVSAQGKKYRVEIALDTAFTQIVEAVSGYEDSTYIPAQLLENNRVYYWRVKAENTCGESEYSPVSRFLTIPALGQCSLGTTPSIFFEEGFENGAPGWSSGGVGDTWKSSTSRKYNGLYAFKADTPAVVTNQWLRTPAIQLPQDQTLLTFQFWNYQRIQNRTGGCYDAGILEISVDGGASWTQLEQEILSNGYHGPVATDRSNPLGGKNAWCGNPQTWSNVVVLLDEFAGQEAALRFRVGTDSSVNNEGWYLDQVVGQGCTASVSFGGDSLGTAAPGQTLLHSFILTNLGDEDSYSLSLHGNAFLTEILSTNPVVVGTGQSVVVEVAVAVPAGADSADSFTLQALSTSIPGLRVSATGQTEILEFAELEISPESITLSGQPGQEIGYTFMVTNTGNVVQALALEISGNTWTVNGPLSLEGELDPGEMVELNYKVSIPVTPLGESVIIGSDTFTVTVTGARFGQVEANATTWVGVTPGAVLSGDQSGQAEVGTEIVYTFAITNTGSYTDSFALSAEGEWAADLPDGSLVGPLGPGESQSFQVEVSVPDSAAYLEEGLTVVMAVSQLDSSVQAAAQISTQALVEFTVAISSPLGQAKEGLAGEVVSYTFEIVNNGPAAQKIFLEISGNAWEVSGPVQLEGELGPGQAQSVTFVVVLPGPDITEAASSDYFVLTATGEKGGMAQAAATTTRTLQVPGMYSLYIPIINR